MAYKDIAHGFDENGNYFQFNATNEPLFDNTGFSQILEFDFTSSLTYLVDAWNGVLTYNGVSWAQVATGFDANSICVDVDSVWVPYDNQPYAMWKAGVPSTGTYTNFKRMAVRKGEIWGCGSTESGIIAKLINETPIVYSADTSILLDNTNYDFKFARNTDSLYVAGASGISIAYNGYFIDTITPNNSINMPSSSIREIEFDQYNNIWALFGTSWDNHTHVGYYDQNTNEWSRIFDATNSPIDWASGRMSIEVDSAGNLYVVDRIDLHVLKVSNWPDWVGIEELKQSKKEVVKVVDLMGRETEEVPNTILIYIYSDGTTEKVFKAE